MFPIIFSFLMKSEICLNISLKRFVQLVVLHQEKEKSEELIQNQKSLRQILQNSRKD